MRKQIIIRNDLKNIDKVDNDKEIYILTKLVKLFLNYIAELSKYGY